MKIKALILVLAVVALTGCGSLRAYTEDVREEAAEYCETYELLVGDETAPGPAVVAYHQIRTDFNAYPPRTQQAFLRVADQLDDLDRLGRTTCLIASGVMNATKWDRDEIERMLYEGLALALKAGAF